MAHLRFDPSSPLDDAFRAEISEAIGLFLAAKSAQTQGIGPELAPLQRLAEEFTAGGKRFRPAFCYWGHVAITGTPAPDAWLVQAAASLDMLHVSALVHDDVMDGSDTRRGMASAHRQLEAWHREEAGRGSAEAFGRAGAILLGDLLLVWSAEMFDQADLPSPTRTRATRVLESMRAEVTCGQFLDVVAQTRLLTPGDPLDPGRLHTELDRVNRVVDYKSARYSVRHPLELGATLAGAEASTLQALVGFGALIGRAFQFRDDLLGVFGDQQVTGKPIGDDLREGKRTVLVAHALAEAPRDRAGELEAMLGDPDLDETQVARARQIIIEAGADRAVENDISTSVAQGLEHLAEADITAEGRLALERLATIVVNRRA